MFADLYSESTDRALRSRAQTGVPGQKPAPGVLAGVASAIPSGLAAGGLEVLRAGIRVIDSWTDAMVYQGTGKYLGRTITDEELQAEPDLGKAAGRLAKSLEPTPETSGTAAQVLHGFAKFGGKAAGYALTFGPAGPVMFGVDEAVNEDARLAEQGVDAETRAKAAAVHGLASAAGAALPLTGKSVAQTVGLAMAGGPVLYSTEMAGIRSILENADYQTIAAGYDPFDPVGLLVSTAAPLAFGGAAHLARARAKPKAPEPTPQPVADAARVELAAQRDRVLSGGDPTDARAQAEHRRGVEAAAEAINAGQTIGADATDRVMLQNRDRSTPAAVAQMSSIAGAPDYYRLSPGRSLAEGAPVVLDEAEIPASQIGADDVAVDSAGTRMAVRYAVIEASKLIPSHKADGTGVSEYRIGQADAMRAVAGNGRVAGLQEAYRRGTAAEYRAGVAADAGRHGVSADVVAGMREPVLVRLMKREDVSADMGDRTNVSGVSDLSPVEQARNDALRIRLDALEFTDQGAPTPGAVRRFVQAMPQAEQSGLMDSTGRASKQAEDRLMAATFAAAYEDPELIHLYAAATDPEARTVVQALAAVSPEVAATRGTDLDMRRPLVEAAKLAVNAKRMGIPMSDLLDQVDMTTSPETQAVARLMAENIRSAKRIIESLRSSARQAVEEAGKADSDMFGAVPKRGLSEILNNEADQAASIGGDELPPRPAPSAKSEQSAGAQTARATPASPDALLEAARGGDDPATGALADDGITDAAVADVVAEAPDMMVMMDDGTTMTAAEALAEADAALAQAQTDSRAFDAAISCFLRTGG